MAFHRKLSIRMFIPSCRAYTVILINCTPMISTQFNYFRSHDLELFKHDRTVLRQLFSKFITPKSNSDKIVISTYYKPKRLSSYFSLRTRRPESEAHGLVYQFTCTEEGCKASYIGYTMNTLMTRAKQHCYNGSKIFSHFSNDHSTKPPKSITENFKILYRNSSSRQTRTAEALLIKQNKPIINVRYNEMGTGLHVIRIKSFSHNFMSIN